MFRLIISFSFILAISGCTETTAPIETADDSKTTELIEIGHASHFKLAKGIDEIVLEIINPESGESEKTIHITPSEDLKIISLTSTLNGMLSILDKSNQLVGVSNIEYVHDEKFKKRFDQGKILEYGDETSQSLEKIVSSGANLIFHSGFGDKFPNEDQLEKLGINVIPVYDWRENDPLGKAEWIKLIGAITKREKAANLFFNKVVKEYNSLKEATSKFVNHPTVLSGNVLGDVWYTPVGDSYVAQLISDAGGKYVYANSRGTGSLALSVETILDDNRETEIWLNPGTDTKEKVLKLNTHAKHLPSFKNMYCYSPNLNKFWERSAAEPHLVLSDLIHIFHPEYEKIKSFNFYQKIQ